MKIVINEDTVGELSGDGEITTDDIDLPPENESSFMLDWKIRKGAIDGQKVVHTGADSQQAA